jgi:hypothetical protein
VKHPRRPSVRRGKPERSQCSTSSRRKTTRGESPPHRRRGRPRCSLRSRRLLRRRWLQGHHQERWRQLYRRCGRRHRCHHHQRHRRLPRRSSCIHALRQTLPFPGVRGSPHPRTRRRLHSRVPVKRQPRSSLSTARGGRWSIWQGRGRRGPSAKHGRHPSNPSETL